MTVIVVYELIDQARFARLFKFSVVCDPFGRMISTYYYLKGGGNKGSDLKYIKSTGDDLETFDRFVNRVKSHSDMLRWTHLMPQSEYIVREDGSLVVDYLGRFETLQQDFSRVAESLGLTNGLCFINQSNRESASAHNVYNKETALIVADIYGRDFANFSYPAELSSDG
jgi:hypothetical protein